jgi:hypothetical protein
MCVTVTTYSEHPCGAVIFSGRSHVGTSLLPFEIGLAYISESIFRLIVVELHAREVIVTLGSTLMGLALLHASSREYQNVRDDT